MLPCTYRQNSGTRPKCFPHVLTRFKSAANMLLPSTGEILRHYRNFAQILAGQEHGGQNHSLNIGRIQRHGQNVSPQYCRGVHTFRVQTQCSLPEDTDRPRGCSTTHAQCDLARQNWFPLCADGRQNTTRPKSSWHHTRIVIRTFRKLPCIVLLSSLSFTSK